MLPAIRHSKARKGPRIVVRVERLSEKDRRHVTSSTLPADCLDRVQTFLNGLKADALHEQARELQATT